MAFVLPPAGGDWFAVTPEPLPVDGATSLGHDTCLGRGRGVPRRRPRPLGGSRRRGRAHLRGLRGRGGSAPRRRRRGVPPALARRRTPRAAPPRRRPHALGVVGRRGGVVAPPFRGLRGRTLLHRHAQGDGADLEARALGGWLRLGPVRARHPSGRRRSRRLSARRARPVGDGLVDAGMAHDGVAAGAPSTRA